MDVELSQSELDRYSTQFSLAGFGPRDQERLKQSRVLVIGAGATGVSVAAQLASSGVGYLGVVDEAKVEIGDLPAQVVHFTPDVGASRADSVVNKLGVLNPEVQVDSYPVDITEDNAEAIVIGYDLVVSCGCDRETRLLVNGSAQAANLPLIDCGAGGDSAALQVVRPGDSTCLACSVDRDPQFGAAFPGLANAVGSLAATEVIKLLIERGASIAGRMLISSRDGRIEVEAITCEPGCSCSQSNLEEPVT